MKTNLKNKMIAAACNQHGRITPVGDRATLEDCFTIESGEIWFWYNDSANSTHVIRESKI